MSPSVRAGLPARSAQPSLEDGGRVGLRTAGGADLRPPCPRRRGACAATANREDEEAVYVCLCNALTDARIKQAAAAGARRPRDAYAACDCRAQCGSCTKAILCLIREAQAACSEVGRAAEA